MAEFNPYQAWLQVPTSQGETPTYYKLLGLAEYEENLQTISKAAEKQLSQLLAIKPEKHRPLWQKLINDLAEAQSTLTHPQHKAAYDNRLRGESSPPTEAMPAPQPSTHAAVASVPAPLPSTPVPQAPAYSPDQGYLAYGQPSYQQPPHSPPAYQQPAYAQQPPTVAPPAQQYSQPQPYDQPPYGQAPYAPPAYAPPAYGQPLYGQAPPAPPAFGQPVYGQPVAPAPYTAPAYGQPIYNPAPAQPYGYTPVAPVYEATPAHDPFQPAGLPNPMAPVGGSSNFGSGGPGAFSAAVNPMAPLNNSRSPLPGTSQNYVEEDASFGEPLPTPNPYRAAKQESPVKYLVMAVLAVVFVIGGFVVKAKMSGNRDEDSVAKTEQSQDTKKDKPSSDVVKVSTPAVPKNTEPQNTEPKNTEPMPAQPEPMKPEPMKPEIIKPEPAMPEPIKPEPMKPGPAMPEPMKPEPMKPEPMKPETMKPVTPEPAKPEPPMPAPNVATPEEQKVIVAKLAEIRVMLGERKFAEAKQALKEVKELAKTPDMEELHLGMDLVVDYSEQFWQAVQQSMRKLSGEIKIGTDTIANVVNSEASEITIRMNGSNRTFKFAALPPSREALPNGLALTIATKWFDNQPANKAVLGAFYYVSKTGSIDEARKYWKEAGNGGVDVKFMLKLLDKPTIHGK